MIRFSSESGGGDKISSSMRRFFDVIEEISLRDIPR